MWGGGGVGPNFAWSMPDRARFVGDFLLRQGAVEERVQPAALFPHALPADVFLDRLPFRTAGAGTMLIVDPPRTGLTQSLIEKIGSRRFPHLLYVSCAADTLARDLKLLTKCGYDVVRSRLVDMFPRTPYFESVTHLRLRIPKRVPTTARDGCS